MKRSHVLVLGLGSLLLAALMLSGCVKPRPGPTPMPTKFSLGPTQGPTETVAMPTATQAGTGVETQETTPSPTEAATAATVEPTPEATVAPTEVPVSEATATPTSGEMTYEVRWGDTLTGIARRFGTTPEAIMARNPRITNRNRIYAGMVLVIPSGSASGGVQPTAAPGGSTGVAREAIDYIVQRGDTLSSIARRFGTTVDAIIQENPSITNRHYIQAGTHLAITMGSGGGAPSAPRTHTVRFGDTLTSLARRYNTTIWAIMVRNNLSNANRIYVGQVLIIP